MIIWIASYPKSGNTWLRSLISTYYFSKKGFFDQNNLKLIDQFPEKKYLKNFEYKKDIPGETAKHWIEAQNKINSEKKIKFFKTHNILGSFNNHEFTNIDNTLGAIYIVRDPRNVITSLKNHYNLNYEEALNFIKSERKFIYDFDKKDDYSDFQIISSWEKNYQSWKNNKIFPIKFIRYEDLDNETFKVFKSVIEFISKISKDKKGFNREKAINSINSTSFETLKSLEKKGGFIESVISNKSKKKIPFFYLGPKNDWKRILDEDIKINLEKNFEQSLKDINYT
tara:strand:+ start:2554 stop:3402 length:849 start_codon:yes stop_codon:yes gene_type:complete